MKPPFELQGSSVREFETQDPFNPENVLHGWLCRVADHKYGMLYIDRVNERPAESIVWATPKMGYPMDREGKFHWYDTDADIKVYTKYDGTNLVGFKYVDADGNDFVSYKTRLVEFAGDRRWGKFGTMWKEEILDKYPEIPELIRKNNANLSFELYGSRNHVLIQYDTPLDIKLLFGRFEDGSIVTPDSLDVGSIPTAELITTITPDSDLEAEYAKLIKFLNATLKVNESDKGTIVEGLEGLVMYYMTKNGTIQYKAKPDYVFDLHTAAGGIPKHSIYVTCKNALEEYDELSFDIIKNLLLEEYLESDIWKKEETIKKTIERVMIEKQLQEELIDEYNENFEKDDMINDKGKVMRYFAQKYPKTVAGKIYQMLWREFGNA